MVEERDSKTKESEAQGQPPQESKTRWNELDAMEQRAAPRKKSAAETIEDGASRAKWSQFPDS